MTELPTLRGKTILVVEDDYFLASDMARSREETGAKVLGPCPDVDTAFDILALELPSAALLDINLGKGPDFAVAEALLQRGIPFMFVTGYDLELVPREYAGVPRLQKPARPRDIVRTFRQLLLDEQL